MKLLQPLIREYLTKRRPQERKKISKRERIVDLNEGFRLRNAPSSSSLKTIRQYNMKNIRLDKKNTCGKIHFERKEQKREKKKRKRIKGEKRKEEEEKKKKKK